MLWSNSSLSLSVTMHSAPQQASYGRRVLVSKDSPHSKPREGAHTHNFYIYYHALALCSEWRMGIL